MYIWETFAIDIKAGPNAELKLEFKPTLLNKKLQRSWERFREKIIIWHAIKILMLCPMKII